MAHKVITWDWKETAPLEEILEAFQEMVDYDQVPQFALPDTGGDYYACILSETSLGPEEVEAILNSEE